MIEHRPPPTPEHPLKTSNFAIITSSLPLQLQRSSHDHACEVSSRAIPPISGAPHPSAGPSSSSAVHPSPSSPSGSYLSPYRVQPLLGSLPQGQSQHQQAFRMSNSPLVRLVAYFEDDVIFQSQTRKPHACLLYQLGVFIYRMAHGHTLNVIECTCQVACPSFPSVAGQADLSCRGLCPYLDR